MMLTTEMDQLHTEKDQLHTERDLPHMEKVLERVLLHMEEDMDMDLDHTVENPAMVVPDTELLMKTNITTRKTTTNLHMLLMLEILPPKMLTSESTS